MKAEHTKGPWHIGIGNGVGSIFGPEDGGRVCLTDEGTTLAPVCLMVRGFGGIVHRNKFPPEDQANARLIAAAPELLEACKELARQEDWKGEDVVPESPVGKAWAAIKKATG